jgi:hypothetical protein
MGTIKQEKFPFDLNKYDIYFLTRRTELKKTKLVPLLEEKKDFHLIISQICNYPLTKRQTKNFSFKFLITLLVFKYGEDFKLSTEHKAFISKVVAKNYCKILFGELKVPNFKNKSNPSPSMAQIVFIMFGLFYDYFIDLVGQNEVESLIEGNTAYMIKGFSRLDIEDVPNMVENGLCVLNKIKEKQWLDGIGESCKNEC